MRVHLSLPLLGVFLAGCARDLPIDISGASANKPEMAVASLHAGMSEEAVRDSMTPVAQDSGTVYWGGSGARRIYFALPQQRQVWVECADAAGDWKVVEVGRIELRQRWIRHGGDNITLE